ncbi:MAG TPA: hypothetical protein VF591_02630 [Pyrinomonadaceae bacterium]|jgi:hypothetical protein
MRPEWVKIERLVTAHIDIVEHERRLIPLYRRLYEKLPALLQGIRAINFEDDAQFEKGYRDLLAAVKGERLQRGARGDEAKDIFSPSSGSSDPLFSSPALSVPHGRYPAERSNVPELLRNSTVGRGWAGEGLALLFGGG